MRDLTHWTATTTPRRHQLAQRIGGDAERRGGSLTGALRRRTQPDGRAQPRRRSAGAHNQSSEETP